MLLWNSAPAADDFVSTCQWRHPQFQLKSFGGLNRSRRALRFVNGDGRDTFLSESEMGVLGQELRHQLRPVANAPVLSIFTRMAIGQTLVALTDANEALRIYRQETPNPLAFDKGKVSPVPVATPPLRRYPAPTPA